MYLEAVKRHLKSRPHACTYAPLPYRKGANASPSLIGDSEIGVLVSVALGSDILHTSVIFTKEIENGGLPHDTSRHGHKGPESGA
ncbi:hypothetical protein M8818_004544 [Zalaria obscura]|uniref:Uncharacterized protein n=1 Tax=Zalaria obscura TaxID=2024903 RepID=A0ACC3SBF2_9PEZI